MGAYKKFPCGSEVVYCGRKAIVRGIQYGHKDYVNTGRIYDLDVYYSADRPTRRIGIAERFLSLPEHHMTMVAGAYGAAMPVRSVPRLEVVND